MRVKHGVRGLTWRGGTRTGSARRWRRRRGRRRSTGRPCTACSTPRTTRARWGCARTTGSPARRTCGEPGRRSRPAPVTSGRRPPCCTCAGAGWTRWGRKWRCPPARPRTTGAWRTCWRRWRRARGAGWWPSRHSRSTGSPAAAGLFPVLWGSSSGAEKSDSHWLVGHDCGGGDDYGTWLWGMTVGDDCGAWLWGMNVGHDCGAKLWCSGQQPTDCLSCLHSSTTLSYISRTFILMYNYIITARNVSVVDLWHNKF